MCASHMAGSLPVLSSCLLGRSPSRVLIPSGDIHLPFRSPPDLAQLPLSPISCPSASGSSFTLQLSWADLSIWVSWDPSREVAPRSSTVPEGWDLPRDSSVFCAAGNTTCFRTRAVI